VGYDAVCDAPRRARLNWRVDERLDKRLVERLKKRKNKGGRMAMETGSGGVRWGVLATRLVGLSIFVLAFFLAAVRLGAAGDPTASVFSGWKCASLALNETVALFGNSVKGAPPMAACLMAASGWLNPLIGIDLLLSLWRGALVVRRIVGVLVLVCMAATWIFFVEEKLSPLLGHFLWIAGALLIPLPDVLPARSAKGA
jgi:hypothetical protein